MSGKLNKQEQVQVVVRIKPVAAETSKAVYLSEQQEKTLVVQTLEKKQYFVFDNIADEDCSQQQLYSYIGKDVLRSSTQGYNCCIFAYGQTGAGKTHSIIGDTRQIAENIESESRGILPRLLDDLFSWCRKETDRWSMRCSYLQIYNEQIIDLLNTEQKLKPIREDFKKGVFVEGLSEEGVNNYEQAMNAVLKGIKNRKVFSTSMNSQSSRSHTIFTVLLEVEIKDQQSPLGSASDRVEGVRIRKSKINIVDLAGSERAKQTKVQGDRLKEGCNINKSLHVLSNVINALVESSKKKKHIPFRDSKLTHYLKDSLGGNSITKLLANIHPSTIYLGDTLSTLMFAKRAKILRVKVEANETAAENYQQLRQEIRKLREELKSARYIKNQSKVTGYDRSLEVSNQSSDNQLQILNWEKLIDNETYDYHNNVTVLHAFEENQTNYKALIQIYEEHMRVCNRLRTGGGGSTTRRQSINMPQEWRSYEKKSQAYSKLIRNIPPFTKIFKENILLREELENLNKKNESRGSAKKCISMRNINDSNKKVQSIRQLAVQQHSQLETQAVSNEKALPDSEVKADQLNEVNLEDYILRSEFEVAKCEYEKLIEEVQHKFGVWIQALEGEYVKLEEDNKQKEERIKELRKRKELSPDLQELADQNEYLKLNVMELEDVVASLNQKSTKHLIQIKELTKAAEKHESSRRHRLSSLHDLHQPKANSTSLENETMEQLSQTLLIPRLNEIRESLEQQMQQLQEERNQMQMYVMKMKEKLIQTLQQNKSNVQALNSVRGENKNLRKKLNSILKLESQGYEIKGDSNINTFWTNEESNQNFSEEFDILINNRAALTSQTAHSHSKNNDSLQDKLLVLQQQLEKQKTDKQCAQKHQKQQEAKICGLQNQISKLQQCSAQSISKLKEDVDLTERIMLQLKKDNNVLVMKLKKLESVEQQYNMLIRNSYKEFKEEPQPIANVRSHKNLARVRDTESSYHNNKNIAHQANRQLPRQLRQRQALKKKLSSCSSSKKIVFKPKESVEERNKRP